MCLKIQNAFSRHTRDECAHRRWFIVTKYHSIFSCVHKTNKKINPSLLLVGLTWNNYYFHSGSLTFKIFRSACRQLLTQHVLALSKTAHVSSQPDPAFKIFLTKIRLHCTCFFCVCTELQPCYFDNQAIFFPGFRICLQTGFRRLSDAPICSTESPKAVREMHIEQVFQLQPIIQTLMMD